MSDNEEWRTAIGFALKARDSTSPADRAARAALRKAASPHTDLGAVPYVAPYSTPASMTALLRATALVAEFNDIASTTERVHLGHFARRLSTQRSGTDAVDPRKPDAVATRLLTLPGLDLEAAVDIVRGILSLGRNSGLSINYFGLTRMLLRWGHGVSDQSQATRRAPIVDYYTPLAAKKTTSDKEF